jgi:hypothetical protein
VPGGGPRVDVYDTRTLTSRTSFFAYESTYRNGVRVAAFDQDGDGKAEVATGAAPGGGPRLRVMDGRTTANLSDEFVDDPDNLDGIFVG